MRSLLFAIVGSCIVLASGCRNGSLNRQSSSLAAEEEVVFHRSERDVEPEKCSKCSNDMVDNHRCPEAISKETKEKAEKIVTTAIAVGAVAAIADNADVIIVNPPDDLPNKPPHVRPPVDKEKFVRLKKIKSKLSEKAGDVKEGFSKGTAKLKAAAAKNSEKFAKAAQKVASKAAEEGAEATRKGAQATAKAARQGAKAAAKVARKALKAAAKAAAKK